MPYHHDFLTHIRYEPLDPVNLIFRHGSSTDPSFVLTDVLKVLTSDGWGQGPQGHLYLLEELNGQQKFRFERAYRTDGPVYNRYHVRFWHGDGGELLASAHKEALALVRFLVVDHEVESLDDGRLRIENAFQTPWIVQRNFRPIGPPIDHPPFDGKATLIHQP